MDFCVCCGAYVPEGTMVCLECRRKYLDGNTASDVCDKDSTLMIQKSDE